MAFSITVIRPKPLSECSSETNHCYFS